MRICHTFTRINEEDGGVSRAVYSLIHHLADAGHDVTLVTSSDSDFPGLWDTRGTGAPTIVPLDPPARGVGGFSSAALDQAADAFRTADVLHLHGMWRISAHQIARLARRLGKPYVMTTHGRLDEWSMRHHAVRKRLFHAMFERRNLAAAARVHVTAQAEAQQVRRWIPHERISIIPYLVDLHPLATLPDPGVFRKSHPEIDASCPTVLFLSRLHPKKGAEILIDAVGLLRQRGATCHLVLAGPGDPAYVATLRARAAERVPDTVFLGMVSGAEKLSLYSMADILALPTSQENFGLVIAEALASGTPVVTTRGTDIWPELESGEGTLLVERTAPAFADALQSLMTDEHRRASLGNAGRQWVFRWLEPTKLLAEYTRMYAGTMP